MKSRPFTSAEEFGLIFYPNSEVEVEPRAQPLCLPHSGKKKREEVEETEEEGKLES